VISEAINIFTKVENSLNKAQTTFRNAIVPIMRARIVILSIRPIQIAYKPPRQIGCSQGSRSRTAQVNCRGLVQVHRKGAGGPKTG
jgi:hypothetical protein